MKKIVFLILIMNSIFLKAETLAFKDTMVVPGVSNKTSQGTILKSIKVTDQNNMSAEEYFVSADMASMQAVCNIVGETQVIKYESSQYSGVPAVRTSQGKFISIPNYSGQVVTAILCGK